MEQQKQEPAIRYDAGKSRIDLIAPEMMFGIGQVLAYGAQKYAERNWEKGMSWGRVFASMMRHMWAFWRGEETDAETGFSHLWLAGCNMMFLIAYSERGVGRDDRWTTPTGVIVAEAEMCAPEPELPLFTPPPGPFGIVRADAFVLKADGRIESMGNDTVQIEMPV